MFKEITTILMLALFLLSSCGKNIVDTEIPQMYKLNLKIELEGKNALDSLSLSQIRESVLKWPNEKEAVFNAEFTTVEEETYLSLVINTVSSIGYDEIFYVIRNPDLFGDDKEHKVLSKWNKENNKIQLIEVLFDGAHLPTKKIGSFDYSIIAY